MNRPGSVPNLIPVLLHNMTAISEIEVFRTPFVLFVFYSVLLALCTHNSIALGIDEKALFFKCAKDGSRHGMMDDTFLPEKW